MKSEYTVIVGNVGTVFSTANKREAIKEFNASLRDCGEKRGRASGESVTLMRNGEPMREADYYAVENTDTFSGEANYCWVNRFVVAVPAGASDARVMREAKRVCGYENVRGQTCAFGDGFEFRPYRICQIMFISYHEMKGE